MNYKAFTHENIDILIRRDTDFIGDQEVVVTVFLEDQTCYSEKHRMQLAEAAHDFIDDFSEASANRIYERARLNQAKVAAEKNVAV